MKDKEDRLLGLATELTTTITHLRTENERLRGENQWFEARHEVVASHNESQKKQIEELEKKIEMYLAYAAEHDEDSQVDELVDLLIGRY